MKRICVVTTSRADYGLLYWTIKGIQNSSKLDLILVAGGLHLVSEIGYSLQNILNDGLNPTETVDLEMSNDSETGIAHSMGLGIEKFTNCFTKLKPDLVLLLGDRFETLSAACAATICHIPVAHCHGGEVTEGAFDESFRHSITKMSQIHFTSSENHKKRVRQLGENPKNIHVVGALGIENINKLTLLSKEEIESSLNLQFKEKNFLVTFHPTTLELDETESQIISLINALKQFNYAQIILTKPNIDPKGRSIIKLLEQFESENSNHVKLFDNLGQLRYLSTVKFMDVVIGNSSSGLIEVPSLGIPTVNIGSRQKGRDHGNSIFNSTNDTEEIVSNIKMAINFKSKNQPIVNPYEMGNSSELIIQILEELDFTELIYKPFFDLN